jgi:AcrR family transcriptional regulator
MAERAIDVGDGRRYRGVPADERRAERRARLIQAAIAVYGEQGYRQATVSAVCREAGLTPRYFYEAFVNSEALLAAAFHAVTEFMMTRIGTAGAATGGPPAERVRATLAAYYDLLRAEPVAARVFLLEIAGISPAIDDLFAWALDRFATLIARTLSPDGHPAPHARPLLRDGATYGLLHIARSWVAGGYARPIDEVVRAALPLCLLLSEEIDAAGRPRPIGT